MAVRVLPSPATALATITTLKPLVRLRLMQGGRKPAVLLARRRRHRLDR